MASRRPAIPPQLLRALSLGALLLQLAVFSTPGYTWKLDVETVDLSSVGGLPRGLHLSRRVNILNRGAGRWQQVPTGGAPSEQGEESRTGEGGETGSPGVGREAETDGGDNKRRGGNRAERMSGAVSSSSSRMSVSHSSLSRSRMILTDSAIANIIDPTANASFTNDPDVLALTVAQTTGVYTGTTVTTLPCTPLATALTIRVFTPDDLMTRVQYSPRTTVILELQNNLQLTRGLLLNASFACTVLRSARGPPNGATISLNATDEPAIRIWNTHNVLILGVGFSQPYTATTPACTGIADMLTWAICPTIHVWGSHHVQIAKGTVFGRIDVYRSMASRIDSMKVTGVSQLSKTPAAIRVSYCGHGPTLMPAYIAITNNEVYGVNNLITLQYGAVGVTVRNNYLHSFIFTGIRCGADVHAQGDCMLTDISNNLVVATARNMNGDWDATGIYYCTHWFNPGNVAECNYVFNGDHCYYLDYVTSGVTIRGGACINTYDGMKVNNGKWNVIEDVVMKNVASVPGWYTCLTPTVNNCAIRPGVYWEGMRKKYYDTPMWNNQWPWMKDICLDNSVDGNPCNTEATLSAASTGSCSGLPSHNYLDLVNIAARRPYGYKYCENLPTVTKLRNEWSWLNITDGATAGFQDFAGNDFGLSATATAGSSTLLKQRPNFKSCPRSKVGPQRVLDLFYYSNFNEPEPAGFEIVLTMGRRHIQDQ